MVHKKYIRRGGKLYGPYFYESYREGNKVKKRYLTLEEYNSLQIWNKINFFNKVKPTLYLISILLLMSAGIIFLLYNAQPTGKISLAMETRYNAGEPLSGFLRFSLKQGELIPQDSRIVVQFGSEQKEFLLSELIDSSISSGNFFAEGTSLSGSGYGYGLRGSRVIYPEVNFELRIISPISEGGEEMPPVEEPIAEPEQPAEEVGEGTNEESFEEEVSELESEKTYAPLTGSVISRSEYIVSGSASKGNDFVYKLEEGGNAEIVSGSVSVNGERIGDENVKLSVSGNNARVSTNYEIAEEGFGKDYLGNKELILDVDISRFGLIASEGTLSVQMVYGDIILASASEEVSVSEVLPEIPEEIPEKNESEQGAGGGFGNETLNETVIEIPIINETLANGTIINETVLNETLVVNETLVKIETLRGAIRIGQPVKWIKNVSMDAPANVTIEIPAVAEKIKVKKVVEEKEEEIENALITGKVVGRVTSEIELSKEPKFWRWLKRLFGITGRAVEEISVVSEELTDETIKVVLDENATNYIVEYYTEAPTSTEIETIYGKRVVISGPEELGYSDIISFANVAEKVSVEEKSKIKVYWVENASYVEFEAYDLDENGMIDYVEWITPHLSEQTFDIILISKAEHLDENRSFVDNVYELVKERDNIFVEIPDRHYLRVTFQQKLDNSRDITIYARSNGSGNVVVYEKDSNEIIADFGEINEDREYKVYLTNLSGEQDTFDLRVSGNVEFDYVVDPQTPLFASYMGGGILAYIESGSSFP
ncbi:MAG: hypothetical protein QXS38_01250, partial [Candidatus Pacearchaeota archaeon]